MFFEKFSLQHITAHCPTILEFSKRIDFSLRGNRACNHPNTLSVVARDFNLKSLVVSFLVSVENNYSPSYFSDSVAVSELPGSKFRGRYRDIGKKHALKKYDQFALNTSCFWERYWIKYYPSSFAISRNFCYKNN